MCGQRKFADREIDWLIDLAKVWQMPRGWQAIIRAGRCDETNGRPFGLSYALILQDESCERLLGFDNSHGFDGAADDNPYDHEHRFGLVGRRYQYHFKSPAHLLNDFFDRVQSACNASDVKFEFWDDE